MNKVNITKHMRVFLSTKTYQGLLVVDLLLCFWSSCNTRYINSVSCSNWI